MREAPDAQVVLEIAAVRAVRPDLDSGMEALSERVSVLERAQSGAAAFPRPGACPDRGAPDGSDRTSSLAPRRSLRHRRALPPKWHAGRRSAPCGGARKPPPRRHRHRTTGPSTGIEDDRTRDAGIGDAPGHRTETPASEATAPQPSPREAATPLPPPAAPPPAPEPAWRQPGPRRPHRRHGQGGPHPRSRQPHRGVGRRHPAIAAGAGQGALRQRPLRLRRRAGRPLRAAQRRAPGPVRRAAGTGRGGALRPLRHHGDAGARYRRHRGATGGASGPSPAANRIIWQRDVIAASRVDDVEDVDPSDLLEDTTTDQASAAEARLLEAFPGASEVAE